MNELSTVGPIPAMLGTCSTAHAPMYATRKSQTPIEWTGN